jgi:NitT/TauT family transport system ATP-binding protein
MSRVDIDIRQKAYPARHGQGEHVAVKDLHLALAAGEFVCLVGQSGCGKTTLLNIVAGLDLKFDGKISVDGGEGAPRIGYVFQNPRLLPWRTVRENIELALPAGEAGADVGHLLEAMGLAQWQGQYPQKLSGGMARRAALARAFAVRPTLLLMDEPFVSLDPPTARRLRQLLADVWQERPHTVLFVTHDLREAITLADRLVFLTGPPATVLREVAVDIPRALRGDEAAVEAFRQRLAADYPSLRALL